MILDSPGIISFIVPAHNEQRLLPGTLAAIEAAGRAVAQPFEIIVVDDSSTDETGAIAAAHGAAVVRVDVRQIARARNAGARVASGSTLIFVDADTIVPAATVRATIEALKDGAAGGGATVNFDGVLPTWARLFLPVLRVSMRAAHWAAGCYVFCTRAAFDAVGGFDERLFASEEIAFSRALGRRGRFVILSEPVTTSGRKLRTHSGFDIVRFAGVVMRRGPAALRNRDALEIWYGKRRDEQ